MSLNALIFDIDGTLIVPEVTNHLLAFNLAFTQCNLPWQWSSNTYSKLLSITGIKNKIIYYLHNDNKNRAFAKQEKKINDACKQKIKNYDLLVKNNKTKARIGAKRLITNSIDNGIRLAIATSAARDNAKNLIISAFGENIYHHFEVIATGDDVTHRKPAGDVYQYILNKMHLEASQCLAIEDSRNGLLAATSAGIKTIITKNKYTQTDNFNTAIVILNNLNEVNNINTTKTAQTKPAYVDINYLKELHAKYY